MSRNIAHLLAALLAIACAQPAYCDDTVGLTLKPELNITTSPGRAMVFHVPGSSLSVPEIKGLVNVTASKPRTYRYITENGNTLESPYEIKGVKDLRSFRKKYPKVDEAIWKARTVSKKMDPIVSVGDKVLSCGAKVCQILTFIFR